MKQATLRTAGGLAAAMLLSTAMNVQRLESRRRCTVWSDWSEPVNLIGVNTPFNEQNGVLSSDELTLYFTSNQPGGHGNLDLWAAQRSTRDTEWGPAVNLPAPINTSRNDLAPNLSQRGHLLLFASDRAGGHGSFDIYVSHRSDQGNGSGWDDPVNLGSPINTEDAELAPFYWHGSLYFNRGLQQFQLADIYRAVLNRHGERERAAEAIMELNSPMNDSAVTIRSDGRELFFWSQRAGGVGGVDIWTSTRPTIHHRWSTPVNVGAPINTEFNDVTPSLSRDGRTLIFASSRDGGMGGNDLWMSQRTPEERREPSRERHVDSRRCEETLRNP